MPSHRNRGRGRSPRPRRVNKRSVARGLADGQELIGYRDPESRQVPIGFHRERPRRPTRSPAAEPLWLGNGEAHSLCIAPTGSGKGRSSLIPKLLTYPGSVVVVDPKGEAAAVTARYRRETLGQDVVVLDPFGVSGLAGGALNPLDAVEYLDESLELYAMATPGLLRGAATSTKEPYWDNKSDDLIAGLALAVMSVLPPEQRHIGKVRELLCASSPKYAMAVLLDTHKGIPEMATQNIANFLDLAEQTLSGVLSTAQQHMRVFADPASLAATSETTFDLAALRDGVPMTLYVVLPANRMSSHAALIRLWLATCLELAFSRRQQPELPTYFLVDELPILGELDLIRTAYTLMRSQGVRVCAYLQDLQQLKACYPKDWQAIVGNAAATQVFRPANYLAAKQIAELFGKDVTPERLLDLAPDEQVVLVDGRAHFAKKLDYLTDAVFAGRFDDNPMYGDGPPAPPSR